MPSDDESNCQLQTEHGLIDADRELIDVEHDKITPTQQNQNRTTSGHKNHSCNSNSHDGDQGYQNNQILSDTSQRSSRIISENGNIQSSVSAVEGWTLESVVQPTLDLINYDDPKIQEDVLRIVIQYLQDQGEFEKGQYQRIQDSTQPP